MQSGIPSYLLATNLIQLTDVPSLPTLRLPSRQDALLVRHLATMLRDIAPVLHASAKGSTGNHQPASYIPHALSNLLSVLVSGHLPERGASWPPAAQAAVAAVYRLHPDPHHLLGPLIQHLAKELASGHPTAGQITRSVFLVGCVATQQLVSG